MPHKSLFYRKAFCAALSQLSPHYLCSKKTYIIQHVSPFLWEVKIGFCSLTFLSTFFFLFCFCLLPSTQKRGFPPKKERKRHSRKSALLNLPQSLNPCFVMVLLDLYCPKGIAPFMRCRNFFSLPIRQGSGAWPSHH